MPNSYRSFVLAAVGFLILANAAQNKDQQGQKGEAQAAPKQQIPASLIIKPAASPSDDATAQQQCIDENGAKRDCTTAASQATVDQASYAYWQAVAGGFGVMIGLATLGAAVWAGTWAKAAARHTQSGVKEAERGASAAERSVAETRRIGEAQVRCYLTGAKARIVFTPDEMILVICFIKNNGQSPALGVNATGAMRIQAGTKNFDFVIVNSKDHVNKIDIYPLEPRVE